MRALSLLCGLALLFLAGCGSANTNVTNTGTTTNTTNGGTSGAGTPRTDNPGARKGPGDFSTPKAAVETFITAASNRDADLLSKSFHADSAGEFRSFREKTASADDLDEMASFAGGGEVLSVQEQGDQAVVTVKFKKRNEEIGVKKSADGWKIVDF